MTSLLGLVTLLYSKNKAKEKTLLNQKNTFMMHTNNIKAFF